MYKNLQREFELLGEEGVTSRWARKSEGCYSSQTEGGEVFNFVNHKTGKSLLYRFMDTEKEFDVFQYKGSVEGTSAVEVDFLRKPLPNPLF